VKCANAIDASLAPAATDHADAPPRIPNITDRTPLAAGHGTAAPDVMLDISVHPDILMNTQSKPWRFGGKLRPR
jgi:hypothetical protein